MLHRHVFALQNSVKKTPHVLAFSGAIPTLYVLCALRSRPVRDSSLAYGDTVNIGQAWSYVVCQGAKHR